MSNSKPDNLAYEDFAKLDIRVGTVVKVELIPKSKKLLKLDVCFGPEIGNRTILAGIATSFLPSTIEGQRVVAVLNLAPRTMMGIESHGMILATHGVSDSIWLLSCNSPSSLVTDGSEVG